MRPVGKKNAVPARVCTDGQFALQEPMLPHGVRPWSQQELLATIGEALYIRPVTSIIWAICMHCRA